MYVDIFNLIDIVIVLNWNVCKTRSAFYITCYPSECTIKFTYERVKIEWALGRSDCAAYPAITRTAIFLNRLHTCVHRYITTDFLTEQNIEEQKSRFPVRAFGLEKTSYLDIP